MTVSQEKRDKIKQTLKETRERRQSQTCKVYQVKIDLSSLNAEQKQWLHKIFIEAKWFYNHVLQQDSVFDTSLRKATTVIVKVQDKFEKRQLTYLSGQMRMGIHERICDAIKTLSVLKRRSFKVGRLKFKPEINSIPLPQYNITWKLYANSVKVQKLKKPLKVNGMDQIPVGAEFANAELVRKSSGYYFHITTFLPKENKIHTGKDVGLDFGIKTTLTTSDGEKIDIKIPESTKLKNLQRHLARKQKGSKQRQKVIQQLKKEYEHISNQKHDKVNKVVNGLVKNYGHIYMQDEMISNWHKGWFGKQVQHSALGAIKSRLQNLQSVSIIHKSFPTTKMCYQCGKLHDKITLSNREFRCDCGLVEDRDIKAAKTVLKVGRLKFHPTEYRITPLEKKVTMLYDTCIAQHSTQSTKEVVGSIKNQ